jgi:nucleoside-diphosphate-sugar epimerase
VHLAALLPPISERNFEHTFDVNVLGTQNFIKASDKDVKILLTSSISVYGVTADESPPIREDHELVPHNNYSRSKIQAEQKVKESDKRYTVLRIAPISMVDLIELPEKIPYRRDQRVEFVLDEDAAQAIVNILGEDKSDVYNIAGGKSWQMEGEEYINRFYDSLGVDVEPNFSEDYTAVDWYSTEKSKVFDYQRTSFMQFEERLEALGREMGLR